MNQYNPAEIEPRWQSYWEKARTFSTPTIDPSRPKYFVLGMFPYPSGTGLHVGHPLSYTALDIVARYKRMKGYAVLHPMGWDAFGLPAERAAIREDIHPMKITQRNIATFKEQLNRLGMSYDWNREINTSAPDYYRWTQWIFLKLYERGLAYLAEIPVNWCPAQGTVLANEEVQDGKYIETGDPVERRMMRQWMLRITAYADRLIEDLDEVDWPESVKEMQRNWIGRSEGVDVVFDFEGTDQSFTAFTTRADTLFGTTYCVLAPEHPLIPQLASDAQRAEVEAYVGQAANRSELERQQAGGREKTGVFTGAHCINPINGDRLPVWVADYVLASYGTGAVMAVPAHDPRDHEFARAFDLPIVQVVSAPNDHEIAKEAWTGDGRAMDSGEFSGLDTADCRRRITESLVERGKGVVRTRYKLRDWLFSRQRYWGDPFPLLHGPDGAVIGVNENDLPVELPYIDEFRPTPDGRPPLARAGEDWLFVHKQGKRWRRETNTMPQWAGSCWYYLRYMDPHNEEAAWSAEAERYWGPVDLYIGGLEHAVLHLLYARFWHKVLFDVGCVTTKEPFARLFNQGMILARSFRDENGKYYYPEEVEEHDGNWSVRETGVPVGHKVEKMSKSKLNVVNPNDVVTHYGADALRMYEMFMGPLDAVKLWQMSGVEGISRFLGRVWRLFVDNETGKLREAICTDLEPDADLARAGHLVLKAVTEGIEQLRFNTPISRMMEFVNLATARETLPRDLLERFVLVFSTYAPHLGEELWRRLGHAESLAYVPWPEWDEVVLRDSTLRLAVQVQGKLRGEILVAENTSKEEVVAAAKCAESVARHLQGADIVQEIYVPGRLVNFVVERRP